MSKEIERKFLLKNDDWRQDAEDMIVIEQAYLSITPTNTVRVRIAGDSAYITIKGPDDNGSRDEFEYQIPKSDAKELFKLCTTKSILKVRSVVIDEFNQKWEIDEFLNSSLVLAEIELTSKDQEVTLPQWIGEEVTHDPQYYNGHIAQRLSAGASKPFDLGSSPSMPTK